jgi:UDP-N-acetyl-D-glucosamine dehydrogenase
VADVRESPGRALMDRFRKLGASVDYHDPHVPVLPPCAGDDRAEASVALDASTVASYDCVVLATNHSSLDTDLLVRSARLIVDTRGALRTPSGAPVVHA